MPFHKGGTWRGQTSPKFRPVCPACTKKGLGVWQIVVTADGAVMLRSCRYCQHVVRKTPE